MKKAIPIALFLVLICGLNFGQSALAGDKLIVHEWGTFTSLQDGQGRVIAGVNTDDEPVPSFVHSLGAVGNAHSEMAPAFTALTTKGGVPRLHPDVTMRLETPVIYFYLPKGAKTMTADVDVSFKGGWLTQYYPDAAVNTTPQDIATKRLTAETNGTLSWKGLTIGSDNPPPPTVEHVWLAPRKVRAATVAAANGEADKFLFYRGVGSAGSAEVPVSATQENSGVSLTSSGAVTTAWLADIRADGSTAFSTGNRNKGNTVFYRPFAEKEYSAKNAAALKQALHKGLVNAGLYDDEATAMLATWEHSYFKSPGMRIFYVVPRVWVDALLPLKISAPADITRVMIGRIELMGPLQRNALASLKTEKESAAAFIQQTTANVKDWLLFNDVASGKKPVSALGTDVPPIYRDYLALGRFRDAILLDESRRDTSPSLAAFIKDSQIGMYDIPR